MKKSFVLLIVTMLLCFSNTYASVKQYGNWYYQCIDNDCKIFTYVEIPKSFKDDPEVHCYVLSVGNNKNIVLQQVYDVNFYNKLYTNQVPIDFIIKNTMTVPLQTHPNGKKIILRFDKHFEISSLPSQENTSYCSFTQNKVEELIRLFREKKEVIFLHEFVDWETDERKQTTMAIFSLNGFSKVYAMLIDNSDEVETIVNRQNNTIILSPIDLVKKHIDITNKLGITGNELKIKQNAKGDGVFVYVPKTEFHGVTRYIVWFVLDDQVFKLNSPSAIVTPNLKWARESYNSHIWKKTGFEVFDTINEALNQVFGV